MNVRVQPGDGLVARTGDGLLLVLPGGTDAATDALIGLLAEVCARTAQGRTLARRLVGYLLAAEEGSVPPFAAAAPTDGGWAVTVHGAAVVEVDGGTRLSGREAATWVDRLLPPGFAWLRMGPDGAVPATDGRSRLDAGVVPGSGLLLELSGQPASAPPFAPPVAAPLAPPVAAPLAEPPPALPPAPVAVPPATPDHLGTEALQPILAAAPPSPPPLASVEPPPAAPQNEVHADLADGEHEGVIVHGILCEVGHFNHPKSLYCSACGRSTVHRTRVPVSRPRPSLGVVVSDSGETYSLDGDYVVGRDPNQESAVQSGQARVLVLEDPERSVSRVHADIRLQDWDVYVVDRGSANGTFVAGRDDTQWTQLPPDAPHRITPGTRIAFGRRVMTFNSHHHL